MYGFVFAAVRDLIITKFGEKKWSKLLKSTNLPVDIVSAEVYSDDELYTLVKSASSLLQVPVVDVLEICGYWFIVQMKKTQYSKMIEMSGNSLPEILANVNSMHIHLRMSNFKSMKLPNFRVTNVKEKSFYLHYVPGVKTRVGLAPLTIGIVKALAEVYLNLKQIKIKQTKFMDKGAPADVMFVKWKGQDINDSESDTSTLVENSSPLLYGLNPSLFETAFPFHFIFNTKFEIVQYGKSIGKLIPLLEVGNNVAEHFTLHAPATASLESFKSVRNARRTAPFLFATKSDNEDNVVQFKGQILYLKNEKLFAYIASPMFTSFEQAAKVGITFTDFAIHDPIKDYLFISDKQRSANGLDPILSTTKCPIISKTSPTKDEITGSKLPKNRSSPLPDLATVYSTLKKNNNPNSKKKRKSEFLIRGNTTSKKSEKYKSDPSSNILKTLFGSRFSSISSSSPSAIIPFLPPEDKKYEQQQTTTESSVCLQSRSASLSSRSSSFGGLNPEKEILHIEKTHNTRMESAFIELLLQDSWCGFRLMKGLLTGYGLSQSNVITSVINLYIFYKKIDSWLDSVISDEVNNTIDSAVLLRSQTVGVCFLSVYIRYLGESYVHRLVDPLVKDVCNLGDLKSDWGYVIMKDDVSLILEIAQKFLDTIVGSINCVPVNLRRVLLLVSNKVQSKFPDMHLKSITSLLFLRFICPAILQSESFNQNSIQKNLRIISKLIQSLANGVEFDGSKEIQMVPFNKFISSENISKMSIFIRALIDEESIDSISDKITTRNEIVSREKVEKSLLVLRDAILNDIDKIWEVTISDKNVGAAFKRFCSVGICAITF